MSTLLQSQKKDSQFSVEPWCESPRVYYLRHFLQHEECEHLIGLAKPKLMRSPTVDNETGGNIVIESRTSFGTFLGFQETPTVKKVEHRIADLLQIPVENGEGMQVLRYEIGQEYRPHFDYFDPTLKGSEPILQRGGQRIATVLMYLNDVKRGGETVFPLAQLSIVPVKGDAVLFYSCIANGQVDPRSLHGSVPVSQGEKWVATKWVREGRFE